MKTEGSRNPFVPGAGNYPPCLAGRGDVQAWLQEDVARMAEGEEPRNEVLVYAPWGHGKTARQHKVGYLRLAGGNLQMGKAGLLASAVALGRLLQGRQEAGVTL